MKKIAFLLVVAVLATACGKNEDPKARLAQLIIERDQLTAQISELEEKLAATDTLTTQNRAVKVILAKAQKSVFSHFVEVQGKVDGEENIGVSPRMAGVVARILVKEGQAVKEGQVLAELNDMVIRQNYQQTKTQLALATTLYQKQKSLWDQKIGSEVQFLTAKTNKENLESVVASLEDQLSLLKITSPISGTIEEIPIRIGQAVSPGIPAFRVVNFSRIKVHAEVAEAYSGIVSPGDEVLVRFPDIRGESNSRISFASKYINPVNRTFTVEAPIETKGMPVRANMIAVLRLRDYTNPSVVQVPINLVQEGLSGLFVSVAREEKGQWVAREIPVTKGRIYGGMAEILTGLSEGDQVITTGYQGLKDGQALEIQVN